MRVLLDTNVVIHSAAEPDLLATEVVALLSAADTRPVVSSVVAWEIAIKWRTGRLRLDEPPAAWVGTAIRGLDAEVLPVTLRHAVAVADLPDHHRDPFDRLLIAQARIEQIPVVTTDRAFTAYDVEVIPAR